MAALDETPVDKDPITKLAWAHYAERIGLEVRQARDVESPGPSEHLTERHLEQTMDQDEKFGDEKEQTIRDLANEWVSTAESPEPHLRPVLTELAERQFKEATALFENSGLGSDFGLDRERWEEHQRQVSAMNLHFHEERERCVRATPEERVTLLVDLYMPKAHPEVMKDPITHLAWTEYADRLALRFRHELTFQASDVAEQIQNRIDQRNAFMRHKENVARDVVKQWAGEDPVEPGLEKLLTNLAERQFSEANALFETSRLGSDDKVYPGEPEEHLAELSVLNGRFREERERYVRDYCGAKRMKDEMQRDEQKQTLDPDKPKLTR
jgi:beta-phosphoglucomutase-like phosphatase (HAD superfamily)